MTARTIYWIDDGRSVEPTGDTARAERASERGCRVTTVTQRVAE